jgi:hypothetical protein
MRRLLVPAVVLLCTAVGCDSMTSKDPAAPGDAPSTGAPPQASAPAPAGAAAPANAAQAAPSASDLKDKAEDSAAQLEIAKIKLERATMDADQQRIDGAAAVEKAKFELTVATKARDHFVNVEMPQKTTRAQLDLQQGKDSLTEQEEELQQLELMYSKDELADKTKEIVLARSKRRLERLRQNLALQQKDLDDLVNVQQPEALRKLEAAVTDKTGDHRRAEFGLRSGQIDKDMAVKAQQNEVNKLTREIEKAKQKAATPPTGAQ